MNRNEKQKGSMLVFFAGFMLPLLILLCSAAIDVHAYSTRIEEVQSLVDDAALYAARYLPDTQAAIQAARRYLDSRATHPRISVYTKNDFLEVKISEPFRPFFAPFFQTLTGANMDIPLAAASRARTAPLDVYIAVDRGISVSPPLDADDLNGWGSPGLWGAAQVFSDLLAVGNPPGSITPRTATQQCFNPVFSAIKQTAVYAYDYFSAFRLNRVSVGFFPGAMSEYGRTHLFSEVDSYPAPIPFLDTHLDWDRDRYVVVSEPEAIAVFPVQSIFCASIAESENRFLQYRIPETPGYMVLGDVLSPLVHQDSWTVDPEYPLQVREKVWSRVANRTLPMDFAVSLTAAGQELFAGGAHTMRQGLVNDASQVVFLVSGALPVINGREFQNKTDWVASGIRTLFAGIRSRKIGTRTPFSLYYIVFSDDAEKIEALRLLFEEEKVVSEEGQVLFNPVVVSSDNPEQMLTDIFPMIILEHRGHAISR